MKKAIWTFGLISGAISSAMMLITMPFQEQIGYDRGMIIGYATIVAASLLIFFGIRSYRDNVAGGTIGFGRAMAVGTLIAVISAACYTVTWEVIYFGFRPDFAAKVQQAQMDKVRASSASQGEIDRKVAELQKFSEMYKNPVVNAAVTMIEPLPVGLILALVSAGILSRRRRGLPDHATTVA
jgi:uncharacterized membrane protein (UPF0136 family)